MLFWQNRRKHKKIVDKEDEELGQMMGGSLPITVMDFVAFSLHAPVWQAHPSARCLSGSNRPASRTHHRSLIRGSEPGHRTCPLQLQRRVGAATFLSYKQQTETG
jgi:hypothetical protein